MQRNMRILHTQWMLAKQVRDLNPQSIAGGTDMHDLAQRLSSEMRVSISSHGRSGPCANPGCGLRMNEHCNERQRCCQAENSRYAAPHVVHHRYRARPNCILIFIAVIARSHHGRVRFAPTRASSLHSRQFRLLERREASLLARRVSGSGNWFPLQLEKLVPGSRRR